MKKAAIQDLTPLLVIAGALATSVRINGGQSTAPDVVLETLRGVVASDEPVSRPLARAHVSVEWDGGRSDQVTTDDQGRFETRVPASRSHLIKVRKAGFAPAEIRRGRSATDRRVDLRLAPGAVVTGTVVDRAGAPVAGLTVVARRAAQSGGPALEREADTDDRGEFRIGNLPAGRYELVVNPFKDIHLVTPTNGGATEMRLKYLGAGTPTTTAVQLRAGEETAVHLVRDEPSGDTMFTIGKLAGTRKEVEPSGSSGSAASRRRATIQGRITDAGGRPVGGALVRVLSDDGGSLVVDSDDEGRYVVAGVTAGVVQIVASKTGFVQTAYGSSAASRTGRRLPVNEGQRITGVDVALQHGSVIAGTVVDESGDPAEGLSVELWQSRFRNGREMVSRVADVTSSKTDDRGQYRLFGVQPGAYYVAVMREQRGIKMTGAASLDGGEMIISARLLHFQSAGALDAPVFYPGRVGIGDALPVALEVGQDAFGVDISLVSTRLARVRGEVVNGSGQPFMGSVSLDVSDRSDAPILESRTVSVSDGTFEFANVPPGDYVIQAHAEGFRLDAGDVREADDGAAAAGPVVRQPEFGMAFVTVADGDELKPPVFIQTSAGSTVTGRLVLEGATEAAMPGLTLRATPVDLDYAPREGKPASVPVRIGRDFELQGLTGPLRFDLEGRLPDGWWLKSITIDGINAADEPMTFGTSSQSRREVGVVLSNDAAEVSGQVTGAATQGSGGSSIVVFPVTSDRWVEGSRYMKVGRAGRNGRFTISGLPPGEYWVAAVDAGLAPEDAGEWLGPGVLSALTTGARRVTLREGSRVSVEVRRSQMPQ
ncbi:MAG TPA: carboxypeptidase regulatory-like domain-containing protein [Vicinamibacterales bacterium]|nr:carboxypeptidase regulatory-like domain-containing protein [Vicinamibacterales bacterium]